MRILLTNDDGIYAPGLAAMERVLREFGVAVEQLVLSNAIEAAPDTPEEALAGIVKARIATLKDTRQRFAKEEQEWREASLALCTFLWAITTLIGALSFLPGGLGATEGSLAVLVTRLATGVSAGLPASISLRPSR